MFALIDDSLQHSFEAILATSYFAVDKMIKIRKLDRYIITLKALMKGKN